ncbi:MAG: FCD domain-containing protein, partial [Brucella anthropi]
AIARMSGNPFMRSVSGLIEAALAISFQLSSPASSREGIAECAANHLRIAHAIASRDPQKARLAMESVIKLGVDRIRDVI